MAEYFRMPGLSADSDEALLEQWLVAEGDELTEGTPLASVETEKAVVDIESEVEGVVHALLCEDGTTVPVGDPILVLIEAGEDPAEADELVAAVRGDGGAAGEKPADEAEQPTPDVPAEGGAPQEAPSGVPPEDGGDAARGSTHADEGAGTDARSGEGADHGADRDARDGRGPASDADADAQEKAGADPSDGPDARGGRLFVTPIVRRLAKEQGIDLSRIRGTGANGRIVRRDFEKAVAEGLGRGPEAESGKAPEAASAESAPAGSEPGTTLDVGAYPGAEFVPHTKLRRIIARRLQESKREAPHFYLRRAVRVDALLELRARLNAASKVKISVNDLVVKAAGMALADVPDVNVVWDGEGIYRLASVDVAVAVASERGLITPVVRDVDQLSLSALSAQVKDLAGRANDNRLKQDELVGGALTVSNLGMYGVDDFDAIINPPQAAILAVGAARQDVVVTDGEIGVATLLRLSLSVDHRSVDGALAAQYLARLVELLEEPFGLLV